MRASDVVSFNDTGGFVNRQYRLIIDDEAVELCEVESLDVEPVSGRPVNVVFRRLAAPLENPVPKELEADKKWTLNWEIDKRLVRDRAQEKHELRMEWDSRYRRNHERVTQLLREMDKKPPDSEAKITVVYEDRKKRKGFRPRRSKIQVRKRPAWSIPLHSKYL